MDVKLNYVTNDAFALGRTMLDMISMIPTVPNTKSSSSTTTSSTGHSYSNGTILNGHVSASSTSTRPSLSREPSTQATNVSLDAPIDVMIHSLEDSVQFSSVALGIRAMIIGLLRSNTRFASLPTTSPPTATTPVVLSVDAVSTSDVKLKESTTTTNTPPVADAAAALSSTTPAPQMNVGYYPASHIMSVISGRMNPSDAMDPSRWTLSSCHNIFNDCWRIKLCQSCHHVH
jgi:hypothetical protein